MTSKCKRPTDVRRCKQDRYLPNEASKHSRKKRMHMIKRRKGETAKSSKMYTYGNPWKLSTINLLKYNPKNILPKSKYANFERADPFNKVSSADPIVGELNGFDTLDQNNLDPFETGFNLLVSASLVDHITLKELHQILLGVMLMTFPQNKENIYNNSR